MQEEQKGASGNDDKRSGPIPAPRKLTKKKGSSEKLKISAPYDFRHVAHLGLDSGPKDLENFSKMDEIDSHLREKDALQNLEAAAAGLHVPSWSSEVLCDKQAQNDDMSKIKGSTATPSSGELQPVSTAKVEPSEKLVPPSEFAQIQEKSSQSIKESAESSTHCTEESAVHSVQYTEKATTTCEPLQKQEAVEPSPQRTENSQRSSVQRNDESEKSSLHYEEGPSLSHLNRTIELDEVPLQRTQSSQKPSSSQNNERMENNKGEMNVPVSKKKSKAPPPPNEIEWPKSNLSRDVVPHIGEVQEVKIPKKSSLSPDEKKADAGGSKDETTQSPVSPSTKRRETVEEASAARKRGNTAPSSSNNTPTVTTVPAISHPPHRLAEEEAKHSLPSWMTDMAAKEQKRFGEVWIKALDRSDRLHSSRNVMEKVAKFEANSSFSSSRTPTRFRKLAPLPPGRQEVLKKCVELDEHPAIKPLRRVVSQPLPKLTAGKADSPTSTGKNEKSEVNKPVPKPRLKKLSALTETLSASRNSDKRLKEKTSVTSKYLPPRKSSDQKMETANSKDPEDSDDDVTTIRL